MPRSSKRLPEGPFYRDLGHSLRTARTIAGKSQAEIADYLDLTVHQIQKYENGTNRIPVDRLVSLAALLEVPIAQFITPSDRDSQFQSLAQRFGAKDFCALAQAWGGIKRRASRDALLDVAKLMAASAVD